MYEIIPYDYILKSVTAKISQRQKSTEHQSTFPIIMSRRHGGAGEGQGGEQAPAKRRREVTAGGGQQAAVAAWGEVPRYFDCLSEDLIGVVLSFLGVRCLDNACHVCKAVSQVARPLMPLWIGVAASGEEEALAQAAAAAAAGTAASRGLPAGLAKLTLQEALGSCLAASDG